MKNAPRRHFLKQTAAIAAGFSGLNALLSGSARAQDIAKYGKLVIDPDKILDLPKGFSYRVVSKMGDPMSDGFKVPGKHDGMAVFQHDEDRVVLVRNHELGHNHFKLGPFEDNTKLPDSIDKSLVFDPGTKDYQPFVGGTTNVVYNTKTGKIDSEFISLLGTDRNCAGGPTPWGTWVTCEEPADTTSEWGLNHGWCFEVPATTAVGMTKPVPLKAMGRMRHEAIAVDEASGAVFLTEDRNDGCIYRFLPTTKGKLADGGKLQALAIRGQKSADTSNWPEMTSKKFPIHTRFKCDWIDLDEVESPKDDLRLLAQKAGAARFTRGEGMWYGSAESVGRASIFWACTDGGAKRFGQIFRYFPDTDEVELFIEPNDDSLLKNADNITIAPWGDLFICEDTKGFNHLRGVTPEGQLYTLARNAQKNGEFAGACMNADGSVLFVNLQAEGLTLAITGPWDAA